MLAVAAERTPCDRTLLGGLSDCASVVHLRCPRCTATFAATPGARVRCPSCRYDGGTAPVGTTRRQEASAELTITPPPPLAPPSTPMAPMTYAQMPPAVPTNGLCVAALVLGLVGMCTWFAVAPAAIGLVLGIVGRSQARARGQAGQGMGVAGITLGAIGLAFGALHWFFVLSVFQ